MAQRGQSQENNRQNRGYDDWQSRLNSEANSLQLRLHQIEESKQALQNNRQFRESQENFEQQIQVLEGDKVSLMKRLNMVLSELEKATHEKTEINHKLLEQERIANDLKRKLDEVSSLKNVVNRNLQEDLRYERDLNEKLKEELLRFEKDKEQLLAKLKDQEILSGDIQRETNAINANLVRKSDELRRLEREHETNLNRLRELNSLMDTLRQQEMHSNNEKRRMEDELEDLTRERNDLIRRMNELSDKYDEYVSTMNRERLEIMKANKNHVKLLTSKLFFQILNEALYKRRKLALQNIKNISKQQLNFNTKLQRFARVVYNFGKERKRTYLRNWYRRAMNVVHENYKKMNLIQFNVNKKRKIVFYYNWRQAFLHQKRCSDSKIESLKIFRKVLQSKQDLQLRTYLCKWRDFIELRQYQQDFMFSVMHRKRQRNVRQGFVRWLAITKKAQLEERYDKMSNLVTSLWFKQRVFLGLRQACMEQKTDSSILKFKAWKNWCVKARQNKYFQRKKLLVSRLHGLRTERLLKQCFDAIKFGNIQDKYEKTRERLEREIPVREELERKRDTLIKVNRSRDKYNLFRQCVIRYSDLKYRALMIWKENIVYHNQQMQRIKLRLIELHKRTLSGAFYKWKEGADKKHMVELVSFTEDLMNENQEIQNTLKACQQQKQQLMDCTSRQQGLKLERIRNMLNRNHLRHFFGRWANTSYYFSSIEDAVFKSTKTLAKRKLRNGFNRYKEKVKELRRLEYIAKKVDWFEGIRSNKSLQECMNDWKVFVKRQISAKKFLVRSIKGIDNLIVNNAFGTWKKCMYDQRKEVFFTNIEELERRQEEHEQQIKEIDHQIQVNDCTQKHLESKLQSQSHKIMANFISRFIYSSQAKGFYTWLDVLKDQNNKRRFLRSTLNYWIKNSQGKAFRTWAQNTLKMKEAELAAKLLARENERKALQKQKDEQQNNQSSEIEDLQNQLNEAISLKDQLQANYEKALQTHINRTNNNTYIDKKRNIFCVWADYVKKEKNAVNVIGAITRKLLRMEVFSRIRLVARERHLDLNAEKVMANFFRIFKSCLVRKAYSKWRLVAYNEVVSDLNAKKDEFQQTKLAQEQEYENMQLHKQQKAEKILKQRRQREISSAWIEMSKVLKALRLKDEIMRQNIRFMQIRNATQKWHKRTEKTLYLRRRDEQVVKKYQSKMLKQIVIEWQNRVKISKLLCNKTAKFIKRLQYVDLAHGFSQIVHFKKSFDERIRERKEYGQQSIGSILSKLVNTRLNDAFLTLKIRGYKKQYKEQFLTRMLKHVLSYRIRHFFGKWKHNSDRLRLAETINTEGDVVLERNEMKRNVKALKDFLMKQGYSEDEIEKYLEDKTNTQKGNMHRALVSLFFKKSEFNIMPKAINQWKRWIQQRKLMRDWSQFTVNAINHPLHWYFRKWKLQEHHALQKLKDVTKKELIDKIIQDEHAIGAAQSRLERMDDNIENLKIQRENLLGHFKSGQKLALALGKNNHQRSLFRAFLRWKKYTKDYEQMLLAEQLDRTNLMIIDLMNHVGRLENTNKTLSVENEELRQAALDGIEIAKAVQELTMKREQLSFELQDKATTIKKLMEDNNNLSMRLSIAQREAEQLEQLNQQTSFMPPPERDRY
ncbi:UNKNOWN [Stylonychia lemnae]|uniref:Uncharacterized protein n=1 Tax=Stylonychia lemnae TaxID=5949 RepID=A0A078AV46_STYLE|nr:UNKNOWN [Stylonychia lemnae]|eukprot:CDW85127.1 UNKNOWN [Stylonychia lemnae]